MKNLLNREATPYLAELLGTFGFVFLGAGSVAVNNLTNGALGLPGIALAHGLALLSLIYALSHVSGAHLNPAVTIAYWLLKKIDSAVAVGYIVFQLAGAILAGIFIEGLLEGARQTIPQPANVTNLQAILIEAILVFILVLVVIGTQVDRRSHTSHGGIAIGLVYTILVFFSFNLTGAALNPARAFGPAFVGNFWHAQTIYWLGPILGAICAAFVYNYGILKAEKE